MPCTPLSAAIRAVSTRKSVSGSAVMPSLTQRSDCTSVQTMPSSSLSWLPRTSFLNCLFVKSFSVGSLHLELASALCPTSLHHPQVATFHHGALFVLGGGLFQTHFIPLRCCEQSMNRPFLSTHKCAPYATSSVWMYWSLDVIRCTCPATSEEVETTPHAIICLSTICSIFFDVSSGSRST